MIFMEQGQQEASEVMGRRILNLWLQQTRHVALIPRSRRNVMTRGVISAADDVRTYLELATQKIARQRKTASNVIDVIALTTACL